MATSANGDIQTLAYEIKIAIKNRLQGRVKRRNGQPIPEYAKRYARSKEIRFIGKTILLPIGYIQHHPPIHKKKSINKYTLAGRAEIHKNLECVDVSLLHILMRTPVANASIEYNDNRISLFVAQHGCCAITKEKLHLDEIHCHHKKPTSSTTLKPVRCMRHTGNLVTPRSSLQSMRVRSLCTRLQRKPLMSLG